MLHLHSFIPIQNHISKTTKEPSESYFRKYTHQVVLIHPDENARAATFIICGELQLCENKV